jgi:hypothetical protein
MTSYEAQCRKLSPGEQIKIPELQRRRLFSPPALNLNIDID